MLFRKYYRYFGLLIIIGLLLLTANCKDKSQEQKKIIKPAKTIVVQSPLKRQKRQFPAKVVASKEAQLAFQVPGILTQLPIQEGMEVDEEQLIGQLDPDKFQDRVDEAQARYNQAKADYQRAATLVKKHYISRADYDKKKARLEITQADLSTTQHDLNDTTLYAPFAGTISKKYVDNHENVRAKQVIILLQDLSYIDVKVNVPENIMINLAERDTEDNIQPQVNFSAVPHKTFPVVYKEHSSEADPHTQTYDVIFTLKAPDKINVLPGMTANLTVMLPDFKSGGQAFFEVPASAVFTDNNNQPMVWLVDPNNLTVKQRPVKISRLSDIHIRVLEGLQPGDRIITAGVHFLQPGDEISLQENKVTP